MPGPNWKGLFSDQKFYDLDQGEQMKAFDMLAAEDSTVSGLSPEEQMKFANEMARLNQPRQGGPVLEGEFAPESTRLAAPNVAQPESLVRSKAAYEAQQENPERYRLDRDLEAANVSGGTMGALFQGARGAVSEPLAKIPVVGEPLEEFAQSMMQRLPGVAPALATQSHGIVDTLLKGVQKLATGDRPEEMAESKMPERIQAVRDWWTKKVGDPSYENALQIEAWAQGFAGSVIGRPDFRQKYNITHLDDAETLKDSAIQYVKNLAKSNDEGGFSGMLEHIGSSTGELAGTLVPVAALYASGNAPAAFMLSHGFLQSENKADQYLDSVNPDSAAGLYLKTAPLALLDTLGAKGILKGFKPGAVASKGNKIARFVGNRGVALFNSVGPETATEVLQQAGNIMIRRHADGLDPYPPSWGPEEGMEMADTFFTTLLGAGGTVVGGQAFTGATQGRIDPTPAEVTHFDETRATKRSEAEQRFTDPEAAARERNVITVVEPTKFEEGEARNRASQFLESFPEAERERYVAGEEIDFAGLPERAGVDESQLRSQLALADAATQRLTTGEVVERAETELDEMGRKFVAAEMEAYAAQAEKDGSPELAAREREAIGNIRAVSATTITERGLMAFVSKLGPKLTYIETPGSSRARGLFYDKESGHIIVNLSASANPTTSAMVGTVFHEVTHSREQYDPEAYAEFAAMVKEQFPEEYAKAEAAVSDAKGEMNESEIIATMAQQDGIPERIVLALADRAKVEAAGKEPGKILALLNKVIERVNKWTGGKLADFVYDPKQTKKASLALGFADLITKGQQELTSEGQETGQEQAKDETKAEPQQAKAEDKTEDISDPEKVTAARLKGGETVTIKEEDRGGSWQVSWEPETKRYLLERKAKSGRVTNRRRLSTMKEVRAFVKTKGGPKFSVTLSKFRETVGTKSVAGTAVTRLEQSLKVDQMYEHPDLNREQRQKLFDVGVTFIEKSELTEEQANLQEVAQQFGVSVFYFTANNPTGGLSTGQGIAFINLHPRTNKRDPMHNVIIHEIFHELRQVDEATWDHLVDWSRKNLKMEWRNWEKYVKDVYYPGALPSVIINAEMAIEDEVMAHIAADHSNVIFRYLSDLFDDRSLVYGTEAAKEQKRFWARVGEIAKIAVNEHPHANGMRIMSYPTELDTNVASHEAGIMFGVALADISLEYGGATRLRLSATKNILDKMYSDELMERVHKFDVATIEKMGEGGMTPKFSVSTMVAWEEKYRAEAKKLGVTKKLVDENVEALKSMELIMNAKPNLIPVDSGELGKNDYGPLRSNGSYHYSVDFDTICVRNMAWDEYRGTIEKRLGRPLLAAEKVALIDHLTAAGEKVVCGYCYVESNRDAFQKAKVNFLTGIEIIQRAPNSEPVQLAWDAFQAGKTRPVKMRVYREKYKTQIAQTKFWQSQPMIDTSLRLLIDEDYRKKAAEQDPRVEVLLKQADKYAQGAVKAKARQAFVPYESQVFDLPPSMVKKINDRAGLRFFSSTDFKYDHMLDLMQAISDASARGLKGHAYTKITEFAEVFGGTGMKIGISLFADGTVSPTENLKHGAEWSKAKELRKKHKDVGTVMVITNDEQLEWAMGEEWIDMIIPWHASQLDLDVGIGKEGWKNYARYSHDIGTKTSANGTGKNYLYADHKNSASKMKAHAKRDGATLRYHNLILPSGIRTTAHDGYMKLATDSVRMDSPQVAMKPVWDSAAAEKLVKSFQLRNGYEQETTVDAKVVDTFMNDVLKDVDKMAEAHALSRKRIETKFKKEQVAKQKSVSFMEKNQTNVDRLVVPETTIDGLMEPTVLKAAEMLAADGSALFQPNTAVPLLERYFDDVVTLKSGKHRATGPHKPKVRFSLKGTSNPVPWTLPHLSRWDAFLKAMQDSFIQFKNLNQMMDGLGMPITEGMNVYLAEETFHGRSATRLKHVDEKYVQPWLREMNRLKKKHGWTSEEAFILFDEYLRARHAKERNAHLEEIWVSREIEYQMEKLAVHTAKLKELQEELSEYGDANPKHAARLSTMIDETQKRIKYYKNKVAQVQEMIQDGKVPNSGMTNEEAIAVFKKSRNPKTVGGRYDKEFSDVARKYVDKMLKQRIDDLLAEGLISKELYDKVSIYDHYVPLKGIDRDLPGDIEDLLNKHGSNMVSMGFDIRGDELKLSLGRTESKSVNPVFAQAVTDTLAAYDRIERNKVALALLDMVEANPNKFMWEVNKVVKKKIFDKKTGRARMVDDHHARDDKNVISAKRDGEEFFITLYDANLASAMKGLGVENVHRYLRGLRSMLRVLAALHTSYSADFILTNFARDFQQAGISLSTDEGKQFAVDVAKLSVKSVRAILSINFPSLYTSTDPVVLELMESYKEQKKEGGTVGFFAMTGIEEKQGNMMKDLDRMGDGAWHKSMRGLNMVFQQVTDMNEATENGIRLATYHVARQRKMSKAKAASLAKNVTVNFNRKGDASGIMGAFYMFFNAGVQGINRFAQSANTARGKKIGAGLMMMGFAQAIILRAAMGEDDDGIDKIDKLSDYTRMRHLLIPLFNDKVPLAQIPLPYGYGIFIQLGKELESMMFGSRTLGERTVESAIRMVSGVTTHFSPLGESNPRESWYGLLSPVMPTLFTPFTDVAANETFWGTPVFPQAAPWDRRANSWRTFKERTMRDKMFGSMTRGLNNLFGGSKFRSSSPFTDLNPEVLGYLLDSFTGPAFKQFGRLGTTAGKLAFNRTDLRTNDVPIIRRFLAQHLPEYYIPSAYYDAVNDVMSAYEERKWFRIERIDPGRWKDRHGWKLGLVDKARKTQARISKLRRAGKEKEALSLQKKFLIQYERMK